MFDHLIRGCVHHVLENRQGFSAKTAERFPLLFFKMCHRSVGTREIDWNGHRGCVSLSFDCDYSADTEVLPELLDLLSDYSFKVSFACIGQLIAKAPRLYGRIVEDGHEIVNHTYSHPDNRDLNPNHQFSKISRKEQQQEIVACHQVCRELLGYEPMGFRVPHFGRMFTPHLYSILSEIGYRYSSSVLCVNVRSYNLPFITSEGILEFPLSVCPRHPLDSCFDTCHLVRKRSHTEKEFLELFAIMLGAASKYNSYINVYFDPQDIIRVQNFPQTLDLLEGRKNDLWIAPYAEIAARLSDR